MNEFIDLVAKMRKYQKKYFKTRDFKFLAKSKELEEKVDQWLANHNNQQLNLFAQK